MLETRCTLRSTLLAVQRVVHRVVRRRVGRLAGRAVADVNQIGAEQGVERYVVAHHADHGGRVVVERHEHRLIAVGPRRGQIADGVVVEGGIVGRDERGGDRIGGAIICASCGGGRRYAGDAVVHSRRLVGVGVGSQRICAEQRQGAGAQRRTNCARDKIGIALLPRAICVIGFSIPFFICTSTRVSCGFDLAANIRSQLSPK